MRIAILVALLSLAGVRHAHASCGGFSTAVSPPTGTRLPTYATIYLFDADHEANVRDSLVISRDDDHVLRFYPTKLSENADYTVHRIEMFGSEFGRTIRVRWNGAVIASYTIAAEGTADAVDRAKVVDVTHHAASWTCSFSNVIQVAVEGNAIAYRIDWEDDRTTVVADEHLLWNEPATPAVFELGHPDCMAYNVDPELLATPRSFELYALFADGRAKYVGTSIAQLDERNVRLPVELIAGADARIPRHFRVALATSPHWIFASGGVGGLTGALVVIVVGRRRRRLRVHASPMQPG